jgi:hypothetical protein
MLIGCPITSERIEHYLPGWLHHVHRAAEYADVDYELIFLSPPGAEIGDLGVPAWNLHLSDDQDPVVTDRNGAYWDYGRNSKRIPHMVEIRNHLLAEVRQIGPDFFLSLDSDIFLAPETISNLLETYRTHQPSCWAVGAKLYMQPTGRTSPSVGIQRKDHLMRPDSDGQMIADVIMGAKLMDPRAYGVDYEFAPQGEDIGWGRAVQKAGGQLMWDGRVCSKHVMSLKWLDRVDPRCGY